MRKNILIAVILSLLSHQTVQACSFGCQTIGNYGIGGPIITMPAYTMPQGKFAINLGLQYQNINQFSTNELQSLQHDEVHTHSRDAEMLLNANMSYAISDDLNLILNIPYRFVYGIQAIEHDEIIDGGNSIGFGDMNLLAKYRFFKAKQSSKDRTCPIKSCLQASLLAGIKLPTGDTNERNAHGERLPPDDQPGTGSWDPMVGLAISYPFGNFSWDTSSIYRSSTQGSQNITLGDQANFNTALTYNFPKSGRFKPAAVFEINGIWQGQQSSDHEDQSHGGLIISLSPGLRMAIDDTTITNLSLSFPVITHLNGNQPEPGIQIGASVSKIF